MWFNCCARLLVLFFLYIDGLLVLMCPVRPDLCCVLSDHYTRLFHYDRFWLMFTHTCRKILYSDSPIRSIVLTFVFKIHFNLKKALKCTILTINWHDDFYKILQKKTIIMASVSSHLQVKCNFHGLSETAMCCFCVDSEEDA